MHTQKIRIFSLFFAAIAVCALLLPVGSEAATKKKVGTKKRVAVLDLYNPNKRYGDEKMDIKNPTSRCVTATTKATHVESMKRALKDGETFQVTTSTPGVLGDAYREYLQGVQIIWEAMEEPYCGFGAFGLSAAQKSYKKSMDRLRAGFLANAKKMKDASLSKKEEAAPAPTVTASAVKK